MRSYLLPVLLFAVIPGPVMGQSVRAETDSLHFDAGPAGEGELGVILRPPGIDQLCVVTQVNGAVSRLIITDLRYTNGPVVFDGVPRVGTRLSIPRYTTRVQAFAGTVVRSAIVCAWQPG